MSNITTVPKDKPNWKRFDTLWVSCLSLLFLAMSFSQGLNSSRSPLMSVWFISIFVAIAAALGFWIGFGESRTRFVAVGIAVLALTSVMTFGFRGPPGVEQFFLFLCFALVTTITVATPIWIVRYWRRGGLKIRHTEKTAEALQFTISQLFIVMTVVGILVGIAKAIWKVAPSYSGNEWWLVSALGATLGISSVVVIWSTLGNNAFQRTIVSAFVAFGLALLNRMMLDSGPREWVWIAVTLLVWAKITVLMWLVRIQGYRFVANSTERERINDPSFEDLAEQGRGSG